MIKVLLAEDEERAIRFIEKGLSKAGMSVASCQKMDEIDSFLTKQEFDILILDRLFQHRDSSDLIPKFRKDYPSTRILVLSALSEVDEKVKGLEYGADDYLGKPFHLSELISRIKSLTRRRADRENTVDGNLKFLDLEIRLDSQKARRASQSLDLTLIELRILALLMKSPFRVYSREELLDRIWGMNFDPSSNVVEKAIGRLRKKINREGLRPLIVARRGLGYCLDEED